MLPLAFLVSRSLPIMGRRAVALCMWLTAGMAIFPLAAEAESARFSYDVSVGSQVFTFPIEIEFESPQIVVTIDIGGLLAPRQQGESQTELDRLIKALKLDQVPGNYQSFGYNGTGGEVRPPNLWLKYHFTVDLKNAKPTNGSVELLLTGDVSDGSVGLKLAERPVLHISNDVLDALASLTGLGDRLVAQLTEALTKSFSDDEARLRLPSWVPSSVRVESATFAITQGRQVLVVTGTITEPAAP